MVWKVIEAFGGDDALESLLDCPGPSFKGKGCTGNGL